MRGSEFLYGWYEHLSPWSFAVVFLFEVWTKKKYGGFHKWGYPCSSSILIGFLLLIDHPAIGVPPFRQTSVLRSPCPIPAVSHLHKCLGSVREFASCRFSSYGGRASAWNEGMMYQWIGSRENLQESPMIFMGKSMVSGWDFPLNQSIEWCNHSEEGDPICGWDGPPLMPQTFWGVKHASTVQGVKRNTLRHPYTSYKVLPGTHTMFT